MSYPVVPPGVGDFRGEAGGEPAAHWKATVAGERLVATHCSFCGVQCGMYLRVAGDRVVGVEPRNHDINKQRLCPKGVVAYQQVHHPDRLLTPLMRDRRDAPLRPVSWDEALDRIVGEVQRIQSAHGRDAFGLLGAFVFIFLQDQVMSVTEYWRFVFGAILAIVVIFFPRGLMGLFARRRPVEAGQP